MMWSGARATCDLMIFWSVIWCTMVWGELVIWCDGNLCRKFREFNEENFKQELFKVGIVALFLNISFSSLSFSLLSTTTLIIAYRCQSHSHYKIINDVVGPWMLWHLCWSLNITCQRLAAILIMISNSRSCKKISTLVHILNLMSFFQNLCGTEPHPVSRQSVSFFGLVAITVNVNVIDNFVTSN